MSVHDDYGDLYYFKMVVHRNFVVVISYTELKQVDVDNNYKKIVFFFTSLQLHNF